MSPLIFTLCILLSALMTAGVIVAIVFYQGTTWEKVITKSRYFRKGLREAVGRLDPGDISRHDRRYLNSPVPSTRSKVKAARSKRSSAVAVKVRPGVDVKGRNYRAVWNGWSDSRAVLPLLPLRRGEQRRASYTYVCCYNSLIWRKFSSSFRALEVYAFMYHS